MLPPRAWRALQLEVPRVRIGWIVAGALLIHVVSAWFNGGSINADEHYQILEFAWYRLGHEPAATLPWEFAARIRPGLQPYIAAGLIAGLQSVHVFTPYLAVFLLRLVSSLLGLWVSLAVAARSLRLRVSFR